MVYGKVHYMKQKISIVIPVHNCNLYLNKCITSIIQQTYKELEIIIVDDYSNDNSIENLNINDNRIKIIRLEKCLGAARARNEGIKIASGKYISFVDSDDWLEPDYFKNFMGFTNLDDCDLICGGHKKYINNGIIKTKIYGPKDNCILADDFIKD